MTRPSGAKQLALAYDDASLMGAADVRGPR